MYQIDGERGVWRRKGWAYDSKPSTSSVKHVGGSAMTEPNVPVSRTCSLVLIDVTAERSGRTNV